MVYFIVDREVDKVKTKRDVENCLKNYKQLKKRQAIDKAYGRVVADSEGIDEYIGRVEQAIDGLEDIQKQLIEERYIKNGGGTYDYVVKDTIMVAERTYYRIKLEALLGLAYGLQMVVHKDELQTVE